MKRASSRSDFEKGTGRSSKRFKSSEEFALQSCKDYFQALLDRVDQLQKQIGEGAYDSDETSDLGDSESEDDVTKEIVRSVLELRVPSLPLVKSSESSSLVASEIVNGPSDAVVATNVEPFSSSSAAKAAAEKQQLQQEKQQQQRVIGSVQLSGFEFCRNVAMNFLKNVDVEPATATTTTTTRNAKATSEKSDGLGSFSSNAPDAQEAKGRMLHSLDLHLAAKQRDYAARLMKD